MHTGKSALKVIRMLSFPDLTLESRDMDSKVEPGNDRRGYFSRGEIRKSFLVYCLILAFTILCSSPLYAFTDADIASYRKDISNKPVGERIALWAERFVGTPYDPDPLGEYVTKKVIIADERVDCMYLSFRSVELALSRSSEDALAVALDKRFIGKGIVENGTVVNYDNRFQYGEDMIDSGKWGREVTKDIGHVLFVKGSRGRNRIEIVSKKTLARQFDKWREKGTSLKSGDFVFFIKHPEHRAVEEIVGHIGIIKIEGTEIYLIHASGKKNKGGEVKKVLLQGYVSSMPFAGIRVSRFD